MITIRFWFSLLALTLFVSPTEFAQADVSSTALTQAQVRQAWVVRYNGPENRVDKANAIAVDGQGNVYVTGTSEGKGTGADYATLKYNTNGKLLWRQRYNGSGNGGDVASAITVDRQGNVYMTGHSRGSGTGDDYATLKYDPNGNLLWEQRHNGPGNEDDYPTALALDKHGNVYVTGSACTAMTSWDTCMNIDYTTLKYDPNGKLLWEQRYDSPKNSFDYAQALALDERGNVYVTGDACAEPTDAWEGCYTFDYATLKYDPNGKLLWEQRYNNSDNDSDYCYPCQSDDQATAIAVDRQGNVYVTGGSAGFDTSWDYATLKYGTTGKLLWERRYNGPTNNDDKARALAVDERGNVYVTGENDSVSADDTDGDYATLKYSPTGTLLWKRHYNGLGKGNDEANALAVDQRGNVYVTGGSKGNSTGDDYATVKYVQGPE